MNIYKIISLSFLMIMSSHLISQAESQQMARYNYEDKKMYSSEKRTDLPATLKIEIDFTGSKNTEIPKPVKSNSSDDNNPSMVGYLVNNTLENKKILTQDNSLIMIMEAQDSLANWRPIEYWIWSDCGNSYFHPLSLEQGQSVTFKIPIYSGTIETMLRLKLLGAENFIYSDVFVGRITKNQLYESVETDKEYFWNEDIYLKQNKSVKK